MRARPLSSESSWCLCGGACSRGRSELHLFLLQVFLSLVGVDIECVLLQNLRRFHPDSLPVPTLVFFLAQLRCELGLVQDLWVFEVVIILQKAVHSIDIAELLARLMRDDMLIFGVP